MSFHMINVIYIWLVNLLFFYANLFRAVRGAINRAVYF
jgi:hypothetical protein